MELFWEKGYQSTSVADLLQRAGAHSGSLYHYFPGKQDVLIAVLDMYCNGIGEMLLDPVWKDVPDPIDRVLRAAREIPGVDRDDRLHLWVPDRQPGARAARARSRRSASGWRPISRPGPMPFTVAFALRDRGSRRMSIAPLSPLSSLRRWRAA